MDRGVQEEEADEAVSKKCQRWGRISSTSYSPGPHKNENRLVQEPEAAVLRPRPIVSEHPYKSVES
jgi:hypothetical protein